MATGTSIPAPAAFPLLPASERDRDLHLWRAPLMPIALAGTLGIVADRYESIPATFALIAAIGALAAWTAARSRGSPGLALNYLLVAAAALGAGAHHLWRDVYPADDIGHFATPEPRPVFVRGTIEEEPIIVPLPPSDPLRTMPAPDSSVMVLRVNQFRRQDDWLPVSGKARLVLSAYKPGIHVGDQVEVVGRLMAPRAPANPGEFDFAAYLRDQRIRAQILVQKTPDGITRVAQTWTTSFTGWLAILRAWGQRTLQEYLPRPVNGVAVALLLGKGSPMTTAEWDKYMRTGVIHVLAISGQHLVVLAIFLWWLLRLRGVRLRRGALLIALTLFLYALLTGGRPPVMRSAVTICVACGALFVRRQAMTANSLALAWLVIAALNPTDLFTTGCQLSFLAVVVLYWGTGRWFRTEPDGLERLVDASRPPWERALRWIGKTVLLSYAVTLAIWLAAAPLVAARYHLVSPIGLLIGPPVVLLTSVALIAGFVLLLTAALCAPLVFLPALLTRWCLAGCEYLVDRCDGLPGAHWYVGDIPEWWLWVFYLCLLAVLTLEPLQRQTRWALLAGPAWLCAGLLAASSRVPTDALRCTFLAVGHGGCTVLETPEGRTLLYDVGALAGPDVTRRQIAPFLWQRGIRRIDEVFLSHADLDHYNGLPALLERFAVGQVTWTPSFADKQLPGVRLTLESLEQHGIPRRMVEAGDRLWVGELEMQVLHPPGSGPDGNENTRSLVLLLRYAEFTLLLTGDLEGPGLARVLSLPPPRVDVLMAPHHGSRTANSPELAAWARPRVVVACQGAQRRPARELDAYAARDVPVLGTWEHGAITVRVRPGELVMETFQTKRRIQVAGAHPKP